MPDYAILKELAKDVSTKAQHLEYAIGILHGGVVAINSITTPLTDSQKADLLDGAKDIHQGLRDVVNQIQTEINKP